MDSHANFYDTDFFGTETPEKNQKFLFEASEPIGFGDELGGLYEHENSIDFSQYIHQSGDQPNSLDILNNFGLSTSPPKPHEFALPSLISIKPDPDAPIDDIASEIDSAPCTPAVTDSNPGSPRSEADAITGEHMPQIDELPEEESVPTTGNFYIQHGSSSNQQLFLYQEPSETASEPSSAQSSPGGPNSKGGSKRSRAQLDKASEEYRMKRERNNVAVRKSRMKSKEKHVGLQKRVDELASENLRLNKKVELLTKELTVLKSLFTNVGKQPSKQLLNVLPQ